MSLDNLTDPIVIQTLSLPGGVIVAPTDTIYGLLARADSQESFQNLYFIRKRDLKKSSIILVSTAENIPGLTEHQIEIYKRLNEERPTTIIQKVPDSLWPHLPKTNGTLAFRAVNNIELAKLIDQVGPLLAPSANHEGEPPASNVDEAMSYFGDKISVYVDGGEIKNVPASKIIAINDGDEIEVIRD